jgi:putative transposase
LERLQEILFGLCQKWDCKLIEFNGEKNHIHLLFQYYPQMELAKFVNNIKSVSSRRIRTQRNRPRSEQPWGSDSDLFIPSVF